MHRTDDIKKHIYFYSNTPKWKWMSNMWYAPFIVNGLWYNTAEHFYQAHKTLLSDESEHIRKARSGFAALKAGRCITLREDWEIMQLPIMRCALRNKFKQNKDLCLKLIATSPAILHENSYHRIFGCKTGCQDMMGKLLMEVRATMLEERQRTPVTRVVNLHYEDYDVKITRPSIYGNPIYLHKGASLPERIANIKQFKTYFYKRIKTDKKFRRAIMKLYGLRLGCVCHPLPCHGDVIVEWIESE